jgi:hypothetical protein
MAGIDYSIPGQIRPIQVESPMNAMAQAMQLRGLQESSQMNALRMQEQALKVQETQETSRQRNALAAYLANPKKPTDPLELEAGVRGVAPLLADKFIDDQLRRADLGIRTEEHRAKIDANKLLRDQRAAELTKEQFQDAVSDLISYDTVDQVKTALAQKVTAKQITQAQADQMTARLPKDNAGIPAWQIATMRNLLTPKERYAEIKARQDEKYNTYKNSEIFSGRVPLSQEDFERQTPTAAPTTVDTTAPAAVPAPAPAPASATVDTTAPAEVTTMPDGAKTFSGVTKVAPKQGFDYLDVTAQRLLQLSATAKTDREAAAYKAAAEKIQAAHVKFLEDQEKRKEFSPEYRDVFLARKKVQELRKLPPTPDVLEEINDALDLIKTSKQGKGTNVRVNVPVSVSTEKKFGEKFAGNIADKDAALLEAAERAPEAANTANRVLGLLSSGQVITGAGANIKLQLAKWLRVAGGNENETIANTEALLSSLADTTLGSIKSSGLGSGQGFTDKDREFLERAKAGQITYDARSLKYLAELSHKAAEATTNKWNKRSKAIPKSAIEGTGISTEDIRVPPLYKSGGSDKTPLKNAQGWVLSEDKKGNKAYVSPDGKQFEEVK